MHRGLLLALSLTAASAFAHEKTNTHTQTHASQSIVREQKDWGIAGDAKSASRVIHIRMDDRMRFTPDRLQIKLGETVRFVIRNQGKLLHEMVIGTRQALEAHAAMMLKHPDMEHDEPDMAHVASGRQGELVWTFNRPGDFEFACLIAGHYQAGMTGTLSVTPATR